MPRTLLFMFLTKETTRILCKHPHRKAAQTAERGVISLKVMGSNWWTA